MKDTGSMQLENIVTVRGNLVQCVAQVKPETILHSDETQKLRWDNKELRNLGAWAADFAQYEVENDGTLYLARRDNNFILENLDEAFSQLVSTGYYKPKKDDAERVKSSESTLAIILSRLNLKGDKNNDYLYFEIDTLNYKKTMNEEQKKIAERAHGSVTEYLDEKTKKMTSDFAKRMEMLHSAGIKKTRIYTLNPRYVKEKAENSAIARVCSLNNFDNNSYFNASNRNVDYLDGALRGVRREIIVAEGDARENIVLAKILGVESVPRDKNISELTDLIIVGQDLSGKEIKITIRNYLTAAGGVQHFEKYYGK